MPIYEFYCNNCNTIYNFFSKTINTTKIPQCPRCKGIQLIRQMSLLAQTGKAKEGGDNFDDFPIDEDKLAKAMNVIEKEAGKLDENDPRKAAEMMRKLSDMTGIQLGEGMHEALNRLENGEDPDRIEAEMGDLIESEDPFILPENKSKISRTPKKPAPFIDNTLYDL